MSKASEWLEHNNNQPRIAFSVDTTPRSAAVSHDGGLFVNFQSLTPDEALKFARWIIDTFEEDGK